MSRLTALSRPLAAGVAAALACAIALPAAAQDDTKPASPAQTKGEARLAKMLEGRVAGEPVRCIRDQRNVPMQTIDKTAYVYGRGNTIWVQRTANPDNIDSNDALVTIRFGASELCKLDQMNTVDRVLGFMTGVVFFEDFVPYTRVKDAGSADS
ncbi:MAG: hypothetical protein RSE14_11155 [Erythrobacter sp.]|jgi:hypothetical protein|uniref:hypothetical protein n=1 Tax=Erythrobacter sp. TaxID=1042 RepID=UPI002B46971B|nr:hypothetical protein [Erythrobacter sp.]WRH69833.1 MAG: hypothetical protein RSE14_11155 [Erythrobacter sp.]